MVDHKSSGHYGLRPILLATRGSPSRASVELPAFWPVSPTTGKISGQANQGNGNGNGNGPAGHLLPLLSTVRQHSEWLGTGWLELEVGSSHRLALDWSGGTSQRS